RRSGDRPRVPDRPAQERLRPQVRGAGHAGREDRRDHRGQKAALVAGGGHRRGLADRARQRDVQGSDRAAQERRAGLRIGAETMAQFGRTWWGERFLKALERFTMPARLARGRAYATNGRVVDYGIEQGTVKAKVRGSVNPYYGVYEEPLYDTRIKIAQIEPADWSRVIERITSRA